ncbi:MAG TPA: MMPL family transporter, partial [Dehalococcoidia bacterium]|nr:MMPL family transporter [Dehalococcoidia bacterium]
MGATTESFLFSRWPRMAARHPWRVFAGAAVLAVALGAASFAWRGDFTDQFSAPGTESQRAIDLLRERFPQQAGDTAVVVVKADGGFDDAATRARVDALVAALEGLPHVAEVTSPFEANGAISPDGRIARITVLYDARARDLPRASVEALDRLRERSNAPGFQVEVGGNVIRVIERPEMGRTELVGLSAAVVVLLVAFGSVVAMALPIGTALLALGLGLLVISLATRFVALPSFTPQFAAMIGLGVGIDYALLIVTRFREALSRGLAVEDAIVEASSTAGRSVLFAGGTVVVAMLGLWAIGTRFVADLGTAAAVIVAFSVGVALLVTPAMLAVAGRNIDRWRVPFVPPVTHESERGFGYRLSVVIQRAPLPALLLALGLLVTLALPLTRIRLGSSDAGSNPTSFTSRRAYDLLSEGFGPGFNGPILIATSVDRPEDAAVVERLPERLAGLPDVAFVAPPRFNDDRTAATITVVPESAPDARETSTLVHALRQRLREETAGSGVTAYVGGTTAAFIDIGERITARLPALIAIVIGLSFALLMMAFRSIVVPVKAALMNLLAIGAAYGVVVAVFQWGWLGDVIGVARTGPIESFFPMFLFAILFGLSMDYEVFLVSRIREEYLRTGDASGAVARGLSLTTRLISAAAAIMVAVFLSFAFAEQRVIKE